MDRKLYHRCSLVEKVISVLKRRYGSGVWSRVWWRQFRELMALCLWLVYNLERAMKLGLVLLALGQFLPQGLPSLRRRISTKPMLLILSFLLLHPSFLEEVKALPMEAYADAIALL